MVRNVGSSHKLAGLRKLLQFLCNFHSISQNFKPCEIERLEPKTLRREKIRYKKIKNKKSKHQNNTLKYFHCATLHR